MIEDYQKNCPENSRKIREFLQKLVAESVEIAELIRRFPSLEYQYSIMLIQIFKQHTQPINVLVQTKASAVQLDYFYQRIRSAIDTPVHLLTTNNYDDVPNCIISDWIPEDRYLDLPYFRLSTHGEANEFSAIPHFLYGVSDNRLA
jgi:hypothetical protein